jgi:hypothetical protein
LLIGSGLLGSWGASGHDGDGGGSGFEELDEDISLFLAGADVWVVFVNVFHDLSFESEFKSEVPDGGEELPHVGSEGKDHASEGVQSLEEVEAEFRSSTHNNTLDKETSNVGHFIGSSLPTINGHWNGSCCAIS